MEEKVLVVPKSKCFFKIGFNQIPFEEISSLIKNEGFYLERGKAEYDFNYYQIIPYVIVKKDEQIFYTKRLKKQSESRLHEKLSIGVGGHINEVDAEIHNIVYLGLKRELSEELQPFSHSEPVFAGSLLDNSNDVSLVHLGLVFYVEAFDDVKIKEVNKMSGQFTDLKFLKSPQIYKKLESWSQILVNNM